MTINVANRVRDEINNDPWKYVANFGYFTENKYPWILHSQIGWVYLSQPGGRIPFHGCGMMKSDGSGPA